VDARVDAELLAAEEAVVLEDVEVGYVQDEQ